MTYSHTFGAWLADVESQLLSRVPAIYLNQIEPSQLRHHDIGSVIGGVGSWNLLAQVLSTVTDNCSRIV